MKKRFNHVVLAGVSALVLALAGVGCSSSGGSSNTNGGSWLSASARAKLTSIIKAASGPLSFTPPASPIDVSSLKGKRVFLMANGLSIPFAKVFLAGMKKAAQVAGVTVSAGDGQGDVSEQSRLIQQAVAEKYDAIVLYSTDPKQVKQAVLKAKAAGIPMVSMFVSDPGLPDKQSQALGVVAQATYCYSCAARLDADYALLHSPSPVHAKFLGYSGAVTIEEAAAAYKDEIAKYCPTKCSVDVVDLAGDYSTVDQRITTATVAAASDGKTNVIDAAIDVWLSTVLPTIKASHNDKIMLTGFNGSAAQLESIKGGSAIKADVGAPIYYAGFAALDQVYRALLKLPPATDEHLGLRIFTPENIDSIDPSGAEAGSKSSLYFGTFDITGAYRRLWGK